MKPIVVLITVILTLGTVLFVSCSFNTKKAEIANTECELILPETAGNKTPLPRPDQKEAISKKVVKIKRKKPDVGTTKVVCDTSQCSGPPPFQENEDEVILSKVEIEAEFAGGAAACNAL